ncbi:DUF5060 domain-containing protein [Paenibacillus sp. GCM10023248]|uniref:DUF5060 domain-containing protein n=1 Tax=Bacillales TaxID=1385 RepID=UPI00237971C8|nr:MULTISPECIES: DUF5060 domain-containing protein [Bacillales]MDD9269178.1 DUF5060 domain-containing protein [Paenibacillus sp. MAHUQ-63]MDR6880602.1 hypothetical protein [Bacillus sp. 3255]
MVLEFTRSVERWGMFELTLDVPSQGNPFTDVRLSALFKKGLTEGYAEGFYDGSGKYRIRYMPDEEGVWTFETSSHIGEMDGLKGEFACTPAAPDRHGPVRVKDAARFHYADGTRFIPFGTTCEAWHLQSSEMQEQTLRTLSSAPFNKVRMFVLPKPHMQNEAEPVLYPFAGSPDSGFDLTRFSPAYFQHLEKRVHDLAALGIQAELVLFHPDAEGGWGFDRMPAEADDRYVRYVVARLGAFSHVWWSLADKYDEMKQKQTEDWNRLFRIIQECDCGGHLRSIHNSSTWYDYGTPWTTHASLRHADVKVISECTKQYGKPAIIEECGYEGNMDTLWGSLSPEELLCRLWEGTCRGGYVMHGESYWNAEHIPWSSHGGELHGKSVRRIEFLRSIMEEAPAQIAYTSDSYDAATLSLPGEYYLQYFGPHRFAYREFAMAEGSYQVDLIDTWNMNITRLEGTYEGRFRIHLPGELYYAIRIQKMRSAADETSSQFS